MNVLVFSLIFRNVHVNADCISMEFVVMTIETLTISPKNTFLIF